MGCRRERVPRWLQRSTPILIAGAAVTRVLLADGAIDLRLGRWQDVLADVERCDAVITDPPYTKRTHLGYRRHSDYRNGINAEVVGPSIEYEELTEDDLFGLSVEWAKRARFWFIAFNDHVGWTAMQRGCASLDCYTFAPVPWVRPDGAPRFNADGPSNGCEWILVSRPRRALPKDRKSARPGAYRFSVSSVGVEGRIRTGQKPLGLMRAIIRDYTKPGDLVVDPFCGGGTTALACVMEGRRCITSEVDPDTFAKARKRLERGFTPDMFAGAAK